MQDVQRGQTSSTHVTTEVRSVTTAPGENRECLLLSLTGDCHAFVSSLLRQKGTHSPNRWLSSRNRSLRQPVLVARPRATPQLPWGHCHVGEAAECRVTLRVHLHRRPLCSSQTGQLNGVHRDHHPACEVSDDGTDVPYSSSRHRRDGAYLLSRAWGSRQFQGLPLHRLTSFHEPVRQYGGSSNYERHQPQSRNGDRGRRRPGADSPSHLARPKLDLGQTSFMTWSPHMPSSQQGTMGTLGISENQCRRKLRYSKFSESPDIVLSSLPRPLSKRPQSL